MGATTLFGTQIGLADLGLDGIGDFGGVTVQDGEGVGGDPVLGGRVTRSVEAPARRPQIFEDVNDIDDDVHVDVAETGFGLDQVELMLGAVDQDHPVPAVVPVARLGVVEDLPHDVFGIVHDRAAQPLGLGEGPWPRDVVACAAAGRSDHVVRAPGRGLAVVDGAEGGHALCVS
ncbi:hypothetical protein [Streptomyces fractus]|uniref:hypothetical protein n=1 Tax=Streptomyces fractus TaxID=641806 RepID=UPI003CE9FE9A